jgi:hypothetical protein
VLGRVTVVHIRDELLDLATKRVVPERYSPLGRLYGEYYAWLGAPYERAIPSYDVAIKGKAKTPEPVR